MGINVKNVVGMHGKQLSNFKLQLWLIFATHKNFAVQVGTAEASKSKFLSTELAHCDPAQASITQLAKEQTNLLTQLSMETVGYNYCSS